VTRKNPHLEKEMLVSSIDMYMHENNVGKKNAKTATSISIFNMLNKSFPEVVSNTRKKRHINAANPQTAFCVPDEILKVVFILLPVGMREW
jgi:hypothetical protein